LSLWLLIIAANKKPQENGCTEQSWCGQIERHFIIHRTDDSFEKRDNVNWFQTILNSFTFSHHGSKRNRLLLDWFSSMEIWISHALRSKEGQCARKILGDIPGISFILKSSRWPILRIIEKTELHSCLQRMPRSYFFSACSRHIDPVTFRHVILVHRAEIDMLARFLEW
jgi:hypothetical protein